MQAAPRWGSRLDGWWPGLELCEHGLSMMPALRKEILWAPRAIESLCTHSVHDPSLQPPGLTPEAPILTPGSRCGSMGSRSSCSSLLGSSPTCPRNQGPRSQSSQSPLKWTVVSQAGCVSREGGWPGLHGCPLPVLLLSFCPSISKLIHLSPIGITNVHDKAKSKSTVSQGDQQV